MEISPNQKCNTTTFHTTKSEMVSNTVGESLLTLKTTTFKGDLMKKKKRKKKKKKKTNNISTHDVSFNDDNNEEEVERKILSLKRIVPGGDESIDVEHLFDQAAAYIMALQTQTKALKALASFVEALDTDKSKFGA